VLAGGKISGIFVANKNVNNMRTYIWQQQGWPYLTWNIKELSYVLGEVRNRQGRLAGKVSLLGLDLKKEMLLHSITMDVIKSAELEGKLLDEAFVRASVAKQLKLNMSVASKTDPAIDRMVQVTTDSLLNYYQPVTEKRIFEWKKALSATGKNADYRNTLMTGTANAHTGDLHMQDSSLIPDEMKRFLKWINTIHPTDPVIKAGVAHLRLTFIHPFDEDNGQIARALTDLFLTRADNSPQRLYSLSAQIYSQREVYSRVMKKAQNGSLDITEWLMWFLYCFETGLIEAENALTRVLEKSKFWEKYRLVRLNERQVKMINLLWDGLDNNLTSSCWANINLCSPDTALRDIQDLINKNILHKKNSGGRSTSYALN
jgi:Fic family protein